MSMKIPRATLLRHQEMTEFRIALSEVSGDFEIKEGDAVVCSGKIRRAKNNEEKITTDDKEDSKHRIQNPLTQEDIYRRLRFLGYEYTGHHRGILEANLSGTAFNLEWNKNWVAFLDAFVQTSLNVYGTKDLLHDLVVPTEFTRILINPIKFYENLESLVHVKYNPDTGIIKCKGVEFQGIKTAKLSHKLKNESPPVVSNYQFEPNFYRESEKGIMKLKSNEFSPLLRCISIVMDNMSCVHDKTVIRTPNILELSMQPSLSETLAVNNAIRVHFCVPEVNYFVYAADLSESMEQNYSKAMIQVKSYEEMLVSYEWVSLKYDLIILDHKLPISRLKACLRSGGFLILKLSHVGIGDSKYDIGDMLDNDPSFQVIANKISEDYEVFLVRKATKKKSKQIHVVNMNHNDEELGWVDEVRELIIKQEEISNSNQPLPRIYFVANGYPETGILGFMNCLRKEPYSSQFRSIYSEKHINLDFENPDPVLQGILDKDLVFNVINESGTEGCYIHSEIKKYEPELVLSAFVEIERPGDLTTFRWVQGFDFIKNYGPDIFGNEHVPVEVEVAGLNFKDLMIATGSLQPEFEKSFPNYYESPIGLEFSGTISEGRRRVCGISTAQCLSTQVLVKEKFLFDIPDHWSFEEAATVPMIYSTAYLALVVRGNLRKGDSVLIHSGAGGVGIAAIRIALSYNCQIFTTVGNDQKIEFLRETFPEIPESNIGCSRDTRFEQMVRLGTNGRGVNIVLNSLAGDKLEASLRCLALHGRFLEIGRIDLSKNSLIGLDIFLRHISIHGIYLSALHDENKDSNLAWSEVKELVNEGISSGVVKPLAYRLFKKNQVEPAFRYMGQGSHIGKTLICIREDTKDFLVPAIPRVFFNPRKSYIIIGGLGGLGHEIINWMTLKYARNFVVAGRRGAKSLKPYTLNYMKIWNERGVTLKVLELDDEISEHRINAIFQAAQQMGPIGGIFNLAMNLDVKLMKLQTSQTFRSVLNPKVRLTQLLDAYSRKMCPELETFVIFSSISAGLGYDGQTNYGYGSSSAERMIELRRKNGLPGVGIQFGPIGDVGAWHEIYNADYNRTSYHGSAIQSIGSVLNTIEYLLCSPLTATPTTLCRRTIELSSSGKGTLLAPTLLDRLAQILGHSDALKINKKATLTELGMESVMSIEAKSVLENEFGLSLSAAGLREYTLEQLNELAQNSQNKQSVVQAQMPKAKPATQGLIQLNFLKVMNRGDHDQIIYPINSLAKAQVTTQESKPGVKLLICNSLEGPDIFIPLGNLSKMPVYSLQYPPHLRGLESCQELVQVYLEKIRKVVPNGPYIIAGLSAGVYPAFELAYILEKSNEVVKLVFMDMTFERFDALSVENGGANVNSISDNMLVLTACQVYGFELEMVQDLIRGETKKDERTNRLFELIAQTTGEKIDSKTFRNNFLYDWRTMTKLFCNYVPSGVYEGKSALIKTTQNLIAYDTSCEDWGLGKVCSQAPDISVIDTTHSYMIAEPAVYKLADILNKTVLEHNNA